MELSEKLITMYINGKGYTSPLQKFITSLGLPYHRMTKEQIYKIGDSKRYLEWKKIQKIKRIEKETNVSEAVNSLDVGQFSQRYKHVDPTHISKKKLIASLVAQGYSPETSPITASKASKFGKARLRVGKRAYKALAKGHARFREISPSPTKKGRTKTIRLLKRQGEYKGKALKQILSSYEMNYKNQISEVEYRSDEEKTAIMPAVNKVDKLVQTNKNIKSRMNGFAADKEVKLQKPMTGKDSNVIEINPKINPLAVNGTGNPVSDPKN